MVDISQLFVLFVILLTVVLVGYAFVMLTGALLLARVASALTARTATVVPDDRSLGDVERHLESLALERHVDSGVVRAVEPERRRPGRSPAAYARPPTDGVRVDVAIPTPERPLVSEWFPLPERLDGRSQLETVLRRYDVPADDLSELLGTEVPVHRATDGRWVVDWHPASPTFDARAVVREGVRWVVARQRQQQRQQQQQRQRE
ncbi:hypothetical protein AUR64_18515 [Haloprofundus marisrubri]|uniref:Uncharacterized protein n=1 Tax=Haloprofundus marisrubri TaxID=1514971 RepID=A0A0W1R5S0_9EURY|nr:hypothetical protein [Haloprofundus marisrubri]KTG08660.1 hypothetical protein AUR64_18515 [Haloprofundus marisrubri]